jgi:hypothetical protein
VFYSNGAYLCASQLDQDGELINSMNKITSNLTCGSQVKIAKFSNKFILDFNLSSNFEEILCYGNKNIKSCDSLFSTKTYYKSLMVLTDENLNYVSHHSFYGEILHMKSNNSNIVCIDLADNYYYFDSEFKVVSNDSLNKIKLSVGKTLINLEMNDQYVFCLCNTNKLKTFDLTTFDLVKEIDTNANQLKLTSASYFFLFNSASRLIQLYDLANGCQKIEEIDLSDNIDVDSTIAQDKTNYISFFKNKTIKYNRLDKMISS